MANNMGEVHWRGWVEQVFDMYISHAAATFLKHMLQPSLLCRRLQVLHDSTVAESKVLSSSTEKLRDALAEANRQLELRLPADAIQNMEQQLEEVSAQLKAATARVAELEEQVQQLSADLGSMTPRPRVLEQLQAHGVQVSDGGWGVAGSRGGW